MKAHGIIETAASPWASNVVLVRDKDNSLQFCIDYRKLSGVTVQDSYPVPLIDNCLNALQGSSSFSTFDLRAVYYNIPIADSDRNNTAFVTRGGCLLPAFHGHAFRFDRGFFCVPASSGFRPMRTFLHDLSCIPRRRHNIWFRPLPLAAPLR